MPNVINEKIREALEKFNDKAAERLASLLAMASEKVDETEAKETLLSALNVMSFFPGIIMLLLNLVVDSRVPMMQKLNLALLIAYMAVPDDAALVALVGPVAFLDDTVVLLYALFLLAQMIGSLSEDVIRDNWVGDPKQADELVKAAGALGAFLGMRLPLERAQDLVAAAE